MKGLDPDLRALQEVRDAVASAKAAQKLVSGWSQATTDKVCQAMAEAGARAAADLARLAVDETGIGRVHYKVLKNLFGSEGTWASIKDEKTVGYLSKDERSGVYEVGTPVGVVAGIVPTTNPTSTTLFKAIIAVKGRNAIVISPHPRAKRCISETVEVLRRAIERAGGPPDLVVCLANPTIEATGALMKHRDIAVILSTGGAGLVKAAYSSGKPAYGVGPGNVPCYVDRSAKLADAAEAVVTSQSFDNATLCCSEQALVLDRPIADKFLALMRARGAHVCSPEERKLLERYANQGGHMNPDVVGLDPWRIAEGAGFHVPQATTVLLAFQDGVGKDHPLSIEILCPLLSVHVVDGWQQGCAVSKELLHYGGLGHTLAVHATDSAVLDAFFLDKPASRIVVNGPSSMGAVGFSTNLMPSFSLGCGPQAGNITSENITARHLVNIKRVAFPRRDWKEQERRAHERALQLLGARDGAPRGSGMPGDPGLALGAHSAPQPAPVLPPSSTNWGGNPASMPAAPALPPDLPRPVAQARPVAPSTAQARPSAPPPPPMAAKVAPAPKAFGAAPRFTSGAAAALGAPRVSDPRPAASSGAGSYASAPRQNAPEHGMSLTEGEIRSMMKHAGAGCPLGPCKGCAHHDATTSSCCA
ncbi:MAG: aldehyde dehydrogenase family protein [Planctomycetota bacterium]